LYIEDKTKEYYLIHSMGLTKKQIKEMLPSEIKKHCESVIKKEIQERGIYNPELDNKKTVVTKKK
jgi:hypothetical protein